MSSIVRATPAQITRRLIVLACAVFAVVVAQAQMLMGWGQTPSEFSADSDATLKVAGYAFSIWGLIYVAILAIVVVALVALAVTAKLRMLAYALPVAWGLLGAFVAEQERNAPLAYVALAAAVAVLVGAVILTFRLRPGAERTAD